MDQVTPADIDFFSDPLNWRGGPMYEVRLVYPPEYPKASITEAIFEFGGLVPWQPKPDPLPKLFKSILHIEELPSAGLVHHHHDLSVKSAEYTLAVYQRQFQRIVGEELGESWASMDLKRLVKLHDALFLLIHTMNRETPVLCASICSEIWGHVEPINCGHSICISKKLAKTLSIPGNPVRDLDYFVAIDFASNRRS
ncbi:hypothetical protein KBI23_06385 [bacterium]|nr:hypothetical protein [bacterium]